MFAAALTRFTAHTHIPSATPTWIEVAAAADEWEAAAQAAADQQAEDFAAATAPKRHELRLAEPRSIENAQPTVVSAGHLDATIASPRRSIVARYMRVRATYFWPKEA